MKIIHISKSKRDITLPAGSPQHWTRCLIGWDIYDVIDTRKTSKGVVWSLSKPVAAVVGDTISAPSAPQRFYGFADVLEIAADYDLSAKHLFTRSES
jgi:hypothetical protein